MVMMMIRLLAVLLALLTLSAPTTAVEIEGKTEYEPHTLAKLKAKGVPEKSAVLWRVYPRDGVERADTERDRFQFAARPGVYRVEVLAIGQDEDGQFMVDEADVEVVIRSCHPPSPEPHPPTPPTPPVPPNTSKRDPVEAVGRIQFGNAGCSATVIGLPMSDGRRYILTAAHCVSGVGARGVYMSRDGSVRVPIRVVTHNRTPDVAWCVTDSPAPTLPHNLLAAENPPVGTPIHHVGFGIDRPGNREDGSITGGETSQGQLQMLLSVSSGDSGGGIMRSDTNEVISTVCCTSSRGSKVSMWGGSTRACLAEFAKIVVSDIAKDDWSPIEMPLREPDGIAEDIGWNPMEIPIRDLGEIEEMLRGALSVLANLSFVSGPASEPVSQPANEPTRPARRDGRKWVWEIGSHGEFTWVTYDDIPVNLGGNSSNLGGNSPYLGSLPECPGGVCPPRAIYQPHQFAPVLSPSWGGCPNGVCSPRR